MDGAPNLTYSDWQGGHLRGCTTRCKDDHKWIVLIRGKDIQKVQKLFPFRRYGSMELAKEAAEEFRRKKSEEIGMKNRFRIVSTPTDSYVEMQLNKEKLVLFDLADLPVIRNHPWYAHQSTSNLCYARTHRADDGGTYPTLNMHTLITGFSFVDHIGKRRYVVSALTRIDGNGLNNRRYNLRESNHSENSRNRKRSRNNSTGIAGVTYNTDGRRWIAQWNENGKRNQICFGVGIYGEQRAKELAIAARKEAEERLGIIHHDPELLEKFNKRKREEDE